MNKDVSDRKRIAGSVKEVVFLLGFSMRYYIDHQHPYKGLNVISM